MSERKYEIKIGKEGEKEGDEEEAKEDLNKNEGEGKQIKGLPLT
jgi:hypothetical protein